MTNCWFSGLAQRTAVSPAERVVSIPRTIKLVLPLPPSANTAFPTITTKKTRILRRVKSAKYREWIRQADAYFLTQKRGLVPITGPYMLRIMVPTAMRGDVSNRCKLVEDFLVSREITPDDRYSRKTSSERHDYVPTGYCWAEITEVPPW